jgi:hypothetical protein
MRLRRWSSVLMVMVCALGAAACGSSSKATGSSSPTSASGPCPFSGSTGPQSQPGASTATQLTDVNSSTAGCIDNVQFKFSPALAASTAAYQTTSSTPGEVTLALTLKATLALPSGKSSQVPRDLNYVTKVQVLTPTTGEIQILVTMPKKQPFLLNSSQVPPELELAIG